MAKAIVTTGIAETEEGKEDGVDRATTEEEGLAEAEGVVTDIVRVIAISMNDATLGGRGSQGTRDLHGERTAMLPHDGPPAFTYSMVRKLSMLYSAWPVISSNG